MQPLHQALQKFTLSSFLLTILRLLAQAFKRKESREKVEDFALGMLCCEGRKTITGGILRRGKGQESWSREFRLMSDAGCREDEMWEPSIDLAVGLNPPAHPFYAAQDDTRLKKTGKRIPGVAYGRDPLSPAFHTNLTLGQRFLGTSLMARGNGEGRPWRSIPVGFKHSPAVKAPKGMKGKEKEQHLKEARKKQNVSLDAIKELKRLRARIDRHPRGRESLLYNAADGSFANKHFLNDIPDKTVNIVRFRKDAKLRKELPPEQRNGTRKYGPEMPTPEQMRTDDSIPWQTDWFLISGKRRKIRFKVIDHVCWQKVTKDRPVRLLIIAPTRYRLRKGSKFLYRQPAYLLVTAMDPNIDIDQLDPYTLIEAYLCRWGIEVNFREAKTDIGIGQQQVWNDNSIERTPAFLMAAYSALLLASILAFNDERDERVFGRLPKWRRDHPLRPSCLDLLHLLRQEVAQSGIFDAHTANLQSPRANQSLKATG